MAEHTFLWHDYETFGVNPRRDRPAQFAAIRTDAQLNEVGASLMLYCQPAPDFVPDAQSCLITGITPQHCLEHGVPEHEFAAQIENALAQNGTIGVGYNTIRFDDEVTRFMLWRNLRDPYAREWQNQCGRWDMLDVVRTAYALRPEGIVWPQVEGKASFKLTELTRVNSVQHEAAHDALSDVRATLALAKLIRNKQPKLFEFCLSLRNKNKAADEISLHAPKPFLHISGMFAPERGCLAVMWPLAQHPTNKNEIIAWNLEADPSELSTLDAEKVRARLFSASSDLPEGVERLPIKTIHLNKSPMVIGNLKTLSPAMAQRWQINLETVMQHAQQAAALPNLQALWCDVYAQNFSAQDVDEDLYSGFLSNADRKKLDSLRLLTPEKLAQALPSFEDKRLDELLFRYRARNFPQSLNAAEMQHWQAHCAARLFEGVGGARTIAALFEQIDALSENTDEQGQAVLGALYDYAEGIAPDI